MCRILSETMHFRNRLPRCTRTKGMSFVLFGMGFVLSQRAASPRGLPLVRTSQAVRCCAHKAGGDAADTVLFKK